LPRHHRGSVAPEHFRVAARRNDLKVLTPLLVMALVIAAGVLFCALTGHGLAAP
jgi:hypothetical protein